MTSSNPVDSGWVAARALPAADGRGNFRLGLSRLGLEAMVKVYGVAVAMPQGQSRVPNPSIGQQ